MLALSTGHQVGLAVTAAAFIVFALASSFLFPRFRPHYPGGGLLAFVVIAFVFFFGMLTAVEVFGAEEEPAGEARAGETGGDQPTTVQRTTTTAPTSSVTLELEPADTSERETTTTTEQKAETVHVDESEFKIDTKTDLKAGNITFEVENDGKIPHDLAIKGGKKTPIIQAGGKTQLVVDLKPGKYHLYCSVPGHEAAGMKIDVTVS